MTKNGDTDWDFIFPPSFYYTMIALLSVGAIIMIALYVKKLKDQSENPGTSDEEPYIQS